MSRVVVVGAGVGGLVAAVRCAEAGHDVTVVEATGVAGGKAGRLERDGFAFDTGPSLLTMPWVFQRIVGSAIDLMPVEPVTRYRFADGTGVDLSADLDRSRAALDAWSPGTGDEWARFLRTCAAMWRASVPVLTGEPPWPPRRGAPAGDPRDLLRVRPWHTLRTLAAAHTRDPRLRMIIERFATYAGADPRRAPAVLAVAGFVEHAFGAWHVRGGIHAIVRALVARAEELGVRFVFGARVTEVVGGGEHGRGATGPAPLPRGRASGVRVEGGDVVPADWVLWNGDAAALDARPRGERSLSGHVLLLGVRGRTPGLAHHTIAFPRDYDAEFDDVFVHRRPVRDPTLYLSVSSVTDPGEAPRDGENWFVLVNAPAGARDEDLDDGHVLERLAAAGLDPSGRIAVHDRRTPSDLGGAIYGIAPHGRLGTLRRPGPRVRGTPNVLRVGGTAHPGGGLPLVALSGELAARIVGRS